MPAALSRVSEITTEVANTTDTNTTDTDTTDTNTTDTDTTDTNTTDTDITDTDTCRIDTRFLTVSIRYLAHVGDMAHIGQPQVENSNISEDEETRDKHCGTEP